MTCYRCGYCCRNVNITGRSQSGKKYNSSADIPINLIAELADIGVPIAGKCVEHLHEHPTTDGYMDFPEGDKTLRIHGAFYLCDLYGYSHRPSFCNNEQIHFKSKDALEEKLKNGEDLPMCLIKKVFGLSALERVMGVKKVDLF